MGATKLQLVMTMVVAIISAGMMSTAMGACRQKDDLFSFKDNLGNGPFFANWTETNAHHCCEYYNGVTCNGEGMVTAIVMKTKETTTGNIPDNLANFPALERLVIGDYLPNISGPSNRWNNIGDLVNLTHVEIIGTKLSGHVPSELGKIPNLRVLILSNNLFHGGVDALVTAPKLEHLDLSYNDLSGPLPPVPRALKHLNLNGNKYEGELITADVAKNWSRLERVELANNQLDGSPMPLFDAGKWSLRYLYLSGNHFSFDMSTAVLPTGLIELDLSSNEIIGAISQQVNELANISIFQVSFNALLCGEIPSGVLSNMPPSFFEGSFFPGNPLCGPPLPVCKLLSKTACRDDAPLARPASLRVDPLSYRFLPLQE